jgi:diadenosine tetraphosphate (Ap4A) HIT family hydrolase
VPIKLANGQLCQVCELVADRFPAATPIRRTEQTIALVVPRQREVGHLIVSPLRHAPTLMDLTNEEARALAVESRAMAQALMRAYDVDGFLVYQNNGTASFQEVPHVHVHVVPRTRGSDWGPMRWSGRAQPGQIAERLLAALP